MKQEKKSSSLNFPQKFLWGVATSAHQVEGNTHNQWSVWELENARSLAKQADYKLTFLPHWDEFKPEATDPNNYVSGRATDHYNRYEADFDLLKGMGLNAFRFSIEWSRIQPEKDKWDQAEIEHYRKYIQALLARGIEPVATLFHFTLPVWFAEMGGFEKRGNIKYFVQFAEKVLQELGNDLRYICTINEPEVYVGEGYFAGEWPPNKQKKLLGFWVYTNLAVAHNRVYTIARRMNRRLRVGLTKNCAHHYPGDDAFVSRYSALIAEWLADHYFFNRIKRRLDWMGLNFYFSNRYYGYRVHNPNEKVSDLGWDMQPENLEFVIERLYSKYNIPIIITESGVADRHDKYRQWWIAESIKAIYRAMQNGAQVDGYLHWSFIDNFEWAYGKWPNFGLIKVNYDTFKRTPRQSALWYAKTVKQIRRK
jgi:beta-glucosidase